MKQKSKKSWLDKKLAHPKFKASFDDEEKKLSIGEQLVELRTRADMTQAEVAKKAGTTASAISRYENADYDHYEVKTLQRIAIACGGSMEIKFSLKKAI